MVGLIIVIKICKVESLIIRPTLPRLLHDKKDVI
jgi:hypothetical protein